MLSVLVWVRTVCKGYQQTTKTAASMERVNSGYNLRKKCSSCSNSHIFNGKLTENSANLGSNSVDVSHVEQLCA